MNQRQAAQQVTEVAVWAREQAAATQPGYDNREQWQPWANLANAADDLAVMIERDMFADRG